MANRKKVLFLITKSNAGGAQRYVRDLAQKLPADQFEVVVAAGNGSQPGSGWLHQEMNRLTIRMVTPPWFERDFQNPLKEIRLFFSLFSLIITERPDILHVNSSKAGGLGCFIGRVTGVKKVIFTAHGWTSTGKRSALATTVISFFEWLTIMLSHHSIMNSDATYRHVKSWPFVSLKSRTVHLGIEPFETFSQEGARENLAIPHEGIAIGTIAELHTNKGVDILVHAYENIPSLHGYIIGDGDEREKMKTFITDHDLAHHVHLLGNIPNAKQYLRAFDIFVLPSRTESLGYVLLEAGLANVPVIATNVGGIPEIIEDGKTGLLVPPENPEALARAIERLSKDPVLQKKLAENLYTKVTEQFSFQQMLDKTIALYNS